MRSLRPNPLWALAAALTACAPDRAAAPQPPEHRPSFLIGDTPARALIGETPTITYDAAAASLMWKVDVNQGIIEAATTGNAAFSIRVSFTIYNTDGQSSTPPPDETSLTEKVALADPRPHPFILIAVESPFDGNDDEGKPMTGDLMVDYVIELVSMSPAGGRTIASQSGTTTVGLIGETPL
jgi:hypothetical protein